MSLRSSVVIPTRNRTADLVETLEGLATQSRSPELVIVVDGSDDPAFDATASIVRGRRRPYPFEVLHRRARPLSRQRNLGLALAASTADFVHVLDDDVSLDRSYCELIESFLARNPDVAMAGGRNLDTLPPTTHRLKVALGIDSFEPGMLLPNGINVQPFGQHARFVDWLPGCVMSMRAAIADRIQYDAKPWPIDDRREIVGEDVRVSLALRNYGRIAYVPTAEYHHRHSYAERAGAMAVGRMTAAYRWDLAKTWPREFPRSRVLSGLVKCSIWELAAGVGEGRRAAFGIGLGVGLLDILARRYRPT